MDLGNMSRISEVVTVTNKDSANEYLKQGWILLNVNSTAMKDGADSWVATSFTLGKLGRDALVESQQA